MSTETTRPEDTGIYWQRKLEDSESKLATARQHAAALREAIINGDEGVTPASLAEADRSIEFAELTLEGARRAFNAFHERMAREGWERLVEDYRAATPPSTEDDVRAALDGIASEAREHLAGVVEALDCALEPGRRHNAAVKQMNAYLNDGTAYRDSTIHAAGPELDLGPLMDAAILAVLPAEWIERIRRMDLARPIVLRPAV